MDGYGIGTTALLLLGGYFGGRLVARSQEKALVERLIQRLDEEIAKTRKRRLGPKSLEILENVRQELLFARGDVSALAEEGERLRAKLRALLPSSVTDPEATA